MSPLSLNATQEAQVLELVFRSAASSTIPTLLLESFMMGVLLAFIPIGSYLLYVKSRSYMPFVSILWMVLVTMLTHWALSLRDLESTLAGRSMGFSTSLIDLAHAANASKAAAHGEHRAHHAHLGDGAVFGSVFVFGQAWRHLLPLVTETVLFGFASSLFAIAAYIVVRRSCSHWRSRFDLIIPAMVSLMYTLSLIHWAIALRCFTVLPKYAMSGAPLSFQTHIKGLDISLLIVFSLNAVMSDSIVLWRMCVVWERTSSVRMIGAVLLIATLGLNIANIVVLHRIMVYTRWFPRNSRDSEIITTYGLTPVGLAAAFLSLATNLFATVLVGTKAWIHRRQVSHQFGPKTRRTLAGRVMELLVESGVVYTAIWLLYCISFFRQITTQTVFGPDSNESLVTAVDHLDGAMAQLTSIYPLAVFILIALDKIHHSRVSQPSRSDEWPRGKNRAVNVSLEIDVQIERSTSLSPKSAIRMAPLQYTDRSPSVLDDTKPLDSGVDEALE
ncbi:unnamed protein product [Peniophora sp. CBMAI 1063]|nr:unnamed protein product [Peniophora sp. CBMAI 1063]